MTHALIYYEFDGTDWNGPFDVSESILSKPQLSLIFDTDGHPAIGFQGGQMASRICASSDAMRARSSNGGVTWSVDLLRDRGGAAGNGDEAGNEISIAQDCDGAIQFVHQDNHFGLYEYENAVKRATWRYDGEEILAEEKRMAKEARCFSTANAIPWPRVSTQKQLGFTRGSNWLEE